MYAILKYPIPILMATVALLVACAPTPRPQMVTDIEGFELPGAKNRVPGMAMVYIARPSFWGGMHPFEVFVGNPYIDSLEAGYNDNNQHFWFSLNPGKHRILSVAENTSNLELDFKADSTYFFIQHTSMGFLNPRNKLEEMDSIEGAYRIKHTSLGTAIQEKISVIESPQLRSHTLPVQGLEALWGAKIGGVTGGVQMDPGLINENGVMASTLKMGFDIGLRYFFTDHLAVHLESGGVWGSAVAVGTKNMDYSKEWSSNLGLVLVPYNQFVGFGFIRYAVSGGLNYTRFTLADPYKNFVESHSNLVFYNDAATGFGWYIGPEFEIVTKIGIIYQIGGQVLQQYPHYPKGDRAFSSTSVLGSFTLGYRY
jgi:hypothetical protein